MKSKIDVTLVKGIVLGTWVKRHNEDPEYKADRNYMLYSDEERRYRVFSDELYVAHWVQLSREIPTIKLFKSLEK